MLLFVLEEGKKENVHICALIFSKTNTKGKPENNELGVGGGTEGRDAEGSNTSLSIPFLHCLILAFESMWMLYIVKKNKVKPTKGKKGGVVQSNAKPRNVRQSLPRSRSMWDKVWQLPNSPNLELWVIPYDLYQPSGQWLPCLFNWYQFSQQQREMGLKSCLTTTYFAG